jgi:predicted AAA+ superfamily ATPase
LLIILTINSRDAIWKFSGNCRSSFYWPRNRFFFGPRSTCKTTLIRQQLAGKAFIIDLLDSRYFLRLSSAPHELESMIAATPADIFVIDEIQRIPELLNEIHRLIESRNLTFLLTGSSARKLRRGRANLLAGRVWNAGMFPLIYREIPGFDLNRYLRYGGLPAVYLSEYPEEELDAYVKHLPERRNTGRGADKASSAIFAVFENHFTGQ